MSRPRILIFTGEGKGKTTAALGLALRAAGHDLATCILQFIKADARSGELAALQVLERTKASVEQWPYVEKGDRVYIEAGPLSGLSGIVTECKKGLRVLVSVSLLQRTVAVEVSRCQIRRTKPLLAHRSAAAGAFAVSRGCFAVGSAAGNRPPADRE